jgi:hypothetical protein
MAGLQAPLLTLRLASRDALRMTRGQSGLLFLYCCGLSPFTLWAVSRRTSVRKFPFPELTRKMPKAQFSASEPANP